jgi:hypothetical protein
MVWDFFLAEDEGFVSIILSLGRKNDYGIAGALPCDQHATGVL